MIDPSYVRRLADRLEAVERELSLPETAANQNRYRSLLAEHIRLRAILDRAGQVVRLARERDEARAMLEAGDTDPELREMAKAEIARAEAELPQAERDFKVSLIPPDPDDSRNTIVEIRAGTGGDEAALFAADLYRMYAHFCEARGWKVSVIDASPSELGGYKEIVFEVEGEDVYRILRFESGGHRVQRVPATEAQGRIHTSAATVAVLAEAEETDDIQIKPEDIKMDTYRAGGAGGQHVNKTDSAVRLTHLPTGLVVQCQDERSQHRNREKAMKVLRTRLLDRIRADERARAASARKTLVGSGDRSDRIRTYNFPQNRLTDHRIDLTLYKLDRIVEGELDDVVAALLERDLEEKLKEQLAGQT
jgi:peptide chain release factor 1